MEIASRKKKTWFMYEALEELISVKLGLYIVSEKIVDPEIEHLARAMNINRPVFSDYCEAAKPFQSIIAVPFWRKLRILDLAVDYKAKFDFFDEYFQFSDNPNDFEIELSVFLLLFSRLTGDDFFPYAFMRRQKDLTPELPDKDDLSVDLAVMKALFQAGKMIERLKYEGYVHSDSPTKAGRSSWKNKPKHQEVIETYHHIDTKGLRGKEAKLKAVREEFIRKELEKRGKKPGELTEDEIKKFTYSTKTIGRILEKGRVKGI